MISVAAVVSVEGHDVLVIHIQDSPRVVGTTRGVYVHRALGGDGRPACIPLHAHEMLAREIERGAVDYAALRVPGASWDDLDPLEFDRFRRFVRAAGDRADGLLADLADREIAAALGFVDLNGGSQPLMGALLLFGRETSLRRFVPTQEAAFQVMDGLAVEVNDILRWPLLRLAEEFFTRFGARNTEEEIQYGLIRVSVPAFAEVAFREALANALIHRDYTAMGAVHVQWSQAAIEISNPGGFPPGIRLDNLLVAPPRPRNPLLADAFKRAGIVERTGRGINRIFEAQLRFGRQAPDYGRTTETGVVAVLPGGLADIQLTKYVVEQERSGQPLSLAELQVVTELQRDQRLTTAELAAILQRTVGEARALLGRMVGRGLVEARGERKGRSYHLSAALYRALDEGGAYVRVRSFEPLQQEQMILAYVDAHGRITRGQAAELCALSSQQAARLLRRLADAGQLVLRGERRGAYYERGTAR
jgi:ATP-dependent DNA helicase RecG